MLKELLFKQLLTNLFFMSVIEGFETIIFILKCIRIEIS